MTARTARDATAGTTADSAAVDAELLAAARSWAADDPDPVTSAEVTALVSAAEDSGEDLRAAAAAELADRFAGTLQFGTAGLRGALGGGPNRMNRAVVIRAAAGLGRYLLDLVGALPQADPAQPRDEPARADRPPRVVIGYDARHRSEDFATDTAAVLTAAGIEALLLPGPLPTPVLAFAVRHLDAEAGVMVTASHNPAADNGYKVYLGGRVVTGWGQGAQIVPPHDTGIAARIAAVPSVAAVPRAAAGWTVLDDAVLGQYLDAVAGSAVAEPRTLRIAYTPLHGVGGQVAVEVLRRGGFTDVHPVAEQFDPDPDFPTAPFPNPEEPGTMDLVIDLARRVGADLVIASDPDADRCAAAVHDPRAGAWRMLHGDEVGALLGEHVARQVSRLRVAPNTLAVASSIVSSRLLLAIAEAHQLAGAQTLTGFKWISRVPHLVYGYEEALGYCVRPDLVRDKDGLSAALLLAELAADLHEQGRSLLDALDDLARAHGLHLTDQLSARVADLSVIPRTMDRLRATPPAALAGSPVVEVTDLAGGADGLPPTDGLRLLAADGTRVIIRPSGTEPKVKCYLEVVVPLAADAGAEAVTAARGAARDRLDTLLAQLGEVLALA